MNVLFLLVPAALLLAGAGVWAFSWAVRSGQFDDTTTPAIRALLDESEPTSAPSSSTVAPPDSGPSA